MVESRFESQVAQLPEREQVLLKWLWNRGRGVIARMAQIVGSSETTISRLINNTYRGNREYQFDRIEARKRRIERVLANEFVETEITAAIFEALDRARDYGSMAMIRGASRRGKTEAIKQWMERNTTNTITPIYLDCPITKTLTPIIRELAVKMGITIDNRDNNRIRMAVEDRITSDHVIIIDEATRLIELTKKTEALEFFRRLHDTIGCGVVFCATDWFSAKINADRVYFEQLLGRLEDDIVIPRDVSVSEIRAHLAPYTNGAPDKEMIAVAKAICKTDGKLAALHNALNDALMLIRQTGEQYIKAEYLKASVEARTSLSRFSEGE